jgi:hypothetical protein
MIIYFSRYLSVDFQLFILSPLLICGIKKCKNLLWLIPTLVSLCALYIYVMSIVFHLHKLPTSAEEGEMYHRWIYHPTHARYKLIGIAMTMKILLLLLLLLITFFSLKECNHG